MAEPKYSNTLITPLIDMKKKKDGPVAQPGRAAGVYRPPTPLLFLIHLLTVYWMFFPNIAKLPRCLHVVTLCSWPLDFVALYSVF